jgi:hypothetical protein
VIPPLLLRASARTGAARLVVCLCLAAALASPACGKKGPPLPPLARVPAAPANVTAARSGGEVTIRFTVPAANITGVQPADIERVDVYAWTGASLPVSDVFKHATVIASVPVRRPPPPPEPAEEGKPAPPPPPPSTEPGLDQGAMAEVTETLAPDAYEPLVVPPKKVKPPPEPKLTPPAVGLPMAPPLQRFYLVVGVNHGGSRGTAAAPVPVPLWPAPPPPTDLAANVREGGVDLTWTPPPARRAPVYSGPLAAPPAAAPAGAAAAPETAGHAPSPAATQPAASAPAAAAPGMPQSPAEPPAGEGAEAGARGAAAGAAEGAGGAEGTQAGEKPLPARLIFPWTAWTTGFLVYEVAPPTLGAPAAPPPAAQPFPKLLTPSPVSEPKFTDPRVEFGTERCYTVRSVEAYGTLRVQSENAAPACVKPSDVFPPAAPKSLAAVASPGAISLIWEPSNEPDLGGYLVYRSQAPDGQPQLLTPKPIRETTYRDESVRAGTRYSYFVVAVDVSTPPNVSDRSNTVDEIAR